MSDESSRQDREHETEFRPMTMRERAVLDVLLAVDFPGVEDLRNQSESALAARTCFCGCPSIDFAHPPVSPGMTIEVNATIEGSYNELFLFTVDGWLGGIEWVGYGDNADELPDPAAIRAERALPPSVDEGASPIR